jgi:Mg2+/Co2+ transporter CorB
VSGELSPATLAGLLLLLLLASAFFSGTETALMTLNRYRLRHAARQGHRGARVTERLLTRPDRLISLILLGNNIVNTLAASLVTVAALRIGGPLGAALGSLGFAIVLMIFGEVMPKTLGALRPERVAYPASFVYYGLLKVMWPFVWLVSTIANGLLRLMGVRPEPGGPAPLTLDELRTIVAEAGALLPRRRQRMLLAILELEDMTVDEIMIPDNELHAIDLDDDWPAVSAALRACHHPRVPLYRTQLDNIVGILPLQRLAELLGAPLVDQAHLATLVDEPFFVPEGTSVHATLVQLQRARQRTALVVDEYGDIQGMVTLEDIVEEILGEFATGTTGTAPDFRRDEVDGTVTVNALANLRELNRQLGWQLPTDGPTTLNGLILEQLGTIPAPGTRLTIAGHDLEVLATRGNLVEQVRVLPAPGGGVDG